MQRIVSPVPDIWPFEYSCRHLEFVRTGNSAIRSADLQGKPYPRTTHKVNRMTRRGDMAIRNSTCVHLKPHFTGKMVVGVDRTIGKSDVGFL